MIVRILGEGQYTVDGALADVLNALDAGLEKAVESGDEAAFRAALAELLAKVRAVGERVPDDVLEPSDAILPSEDSDLEEVSAMLSGTAEGLIPG